MHLRLTDISVRTGLSRCLKSARQRTRGFLCLLRLPIHPPMSCKIRFLRAASPCMRQWPLLRNMGRNLQGKYGYSGVGAVVGATWPAQLGELRGKLTHTFFLVPGYGAQGGGADDVAPAFDQRGLGAVVNASRSHHVRVAGTKCPAGRLRQSSRTGSRAYA
jgi:hypothetical protein